MWCSSCFVCTVSSARRCSEAHHSAQMCSVLPSLLYGVNTALTELTLCDAPEDKEQPTLAFSCAMVGVTAAAGNTIQTLRLRRPALMPPAAHLPNMNTLIMDFAIAGPGWHGEFADSVMTRYGHRPA